MNSKIEIYTVGVPDHAKCASSCIFGIFAHYVGVPDHANVLLGVFLVSHTPHRPHPTDFDPHPKMYFTEVHIWMGVRGGGSDLYLPRPPPPVVSARIAAKSGKFLPLPYF